MLLQHLKSVDEGIARTEAAMKMALADSIFYDLISDTAEALLEAHGEQLPLEKSCQNDTDIDAALDMV